MPAVVPAFVKPVLDDYIAAVNNTLPGFMTGFYLHGSIALGDFHERFSDVDFITVISSRASENDINELVNIHKGLKQKYPGCLLSGSYLQAGDLGREESAIEAYPFYQDGALNPRGHHDINFVTWWVLKNHGIALVGTAPGALNFTMDWDQFAAATRENMNSYWAGFTQKPAKIVWLLSDYGIQWTVLGVLRQVYTLKESGITSKTGAGDYGLKISPAKWHCIIQEALGLRRREKSVYRFGLARAWDAFQFLKYAIQLGNAH